ncbi:MAG: DUF2459 domain-containing protein [Gammaproteobacteria bacterium]
MRHRLRRSLFISPRRTDDPGLFGQRPWHAGVVIKISDIRGELVPESHDFPEADYLEFSWGDWDFYQAPRFNLGYAIKALLFPTKSVLHVVGFSGPVVNYAPYREIIQFRPSSRNFERLAGYIDESFARLGTRAATPLGRGLYGNSRFYPARGKFHLFNTCNTWAARALGAAGYSISPAVMVDTLVSEARQFGDPIQAGR